MSDYTRAEACVIAAAEAYRGDSLIDLHFDRCPAR